MNGLIDFFASLRPSSAAAMSAAVDAAINQLCPAPVHRCGEHCRRDRGGRPLEEVTRGTADA